MKIDGFTLICDECGREYNEFDDAGVEDTQLCPVCASTQYSTFINSLCEICGKPIGETSEVCYKEDESDVYAHEPCVETLPEEEQEQWYSFWD